MKRFLFFLIIIFNCIVATALLCSYIAIFISPNIKWIFAFFGLAYPYIALLNLVFVFYWIIRLRWWFLLSAIIFLIGFACFRNTYPIRFSSAIKPHTQNSFKILSYNVRLFDLYDWNQNKDVRNKIFIFLQKEKPDIVCFQEFYSDETREFTCSDTIIKILNTKYSHVAYTSHVMGIHHFGIATFSKFPIINKQIVRFENTHNLSIYCDIITPTDTIRLFNNHLESIRFHAENYNFLDSIKYKATNNKFNGLKDIIKKMRKAYIKRSQQADIIASLICKSPYPVIVCGDFNDTPVSYTYNTIKGDMNDAFVVSGNGFGSTYHGNIPTNRIDYILHSKELTSYNFEVFKTDYSDHYPIMCWITPTTKK